MYELEETCVENFGVETEGKIPLGRPRNRWWENSEIYLREIGWRRLWD